MNQSHSPYIPETIDEIVDKLGAMMLSAPTFMDVDFPSKTLETEFFVLREGLKRIRSQIGDERYLALVELSERMRAHFKADQGNLTHDTVKGRQLIHEMEDLLSARRQKPNGES